MAAPKGHPKYGGRSKGTPNKVTQEVQAAAKAFVEDPEYRAQLLIAMKERQVPPGVEIMLWNYAYGKPKEAPQALQADVRVMFGGRYQPEAG